MRQNILSECGMTDFLDAGGLSANLAWLVLVQAIW